MSAVTVSRTDDVEVATEDLADDDLGDAFEGGQDVAAAHAVLPVDEDQRRDDNTGVLTRADNGAAGDVALTLQPFDALAHRIAGQQLIRGGSATRVSSLWMPGVAVHLMCTPTRRLCTPTRRQPGEEEPRLPPGCRGSLTPQTPAQLLQDAPCRR
ncbi:hypothetical protein ACIBAG_00955 [Streptomyces sp. NPDC051243]|uniref:hypothetical protein n=1 Tax=Streptomyces sp. NPDC051243 TaxID=3365646 RepID=UPI0037BB76EE